MVIKKPRFCDTKRWQDRWYLRTRKWLWNLRHPINYLWYQELSECDEFQHTAQYKRPICWIIGHDWTVIAEDEYWINSSIVGIHYYSICVRCFKI